VGTDAVGVGSEFVKPSPDAAAAVVESSPRVEGKGRYNFAVELARDTTESGNYPIVLVTYEIACTTYPDAQQAGVVRAFFDYIVSEQGQQAAASAAGSAPLTDAQRSQYKPAVDAIAAGS
jgi:phosphate transport system substrate-binding protein